MYTCVLICWIRWKNDDESYENHIKETEIVYVMLVFSNLERNWDTETDG